MKKKKQKKGFNDGYISFSTEELHEAAASNSLNAEAYQWLNKAVSTSSKVQKKNKKGKVIDIDDIYPVTADETEQMRLCLDQAEACAGDRSDSTFNARLNELRSIVNWSSQRHSTFQWLIIGGVVLTLVFISIMVSDSKDLVKGRESRKATVEKWEKQDTTLVFETMGSVGTRPMIEYSSANTYKLTELRRLKYYHGQELKNETNYRHSADTATTSKNKKLYLDKAEKALKSHTEYRKEFDKINEMNFRAIHKMGKADAKASLKSARKEARRIMRINLFFILIIPLYIFSQRPYGYTITRLRLESKILGGIQKFFFGLAGGMTAAAFAMEFEPDTIVKWSDGSTTRENDSVAPVMALKAIFYSIAIFIFCSVSCGLIIYMTVQGLRRNYNWDPIIAKARGAAVIAADKASDAIAKQQAQIGNQSQEVDQSEEVDQIEEAEEVEEAELKEQSQEEEENK